MYEEHLTSDTNTDQEHLIQLIVDMCHCGVNVFTQRLLLHSGE